MRRHQVAALIDTTTAHHVRDIEESSYCRVLTSEAQSDILRSLFRHIAVFGILNATY